MYHVKEKQFLKESRHIKRGTKDLENAERIGWKQKIHFKLQVYTLGSSHTQNPSQNTFKIKNMLFGHFEKLVGPKKFSAALKKKKKNQTNTSTTWCNG